jgi:transcriptional regulator with PAS, ATPase and Fis domain
MKRKLYILLTACVLSFWCLTTPTFAQNKMFEKYSDMENVEYICITRSMIKLMGQKKNVNINGVKVNGFSDAIKVILIINSDDETARKQMKADFEKLKADSHYELLMVAKDNTSRVTTLYNSEDEIKELVMYISEEDEQTFVIMTGKMTEDMINKLLASDENDR